MYVQGLTDARVKESKYIVHLTSWLAHVVKPSFIENHPPQRSPLFDFLDLRALSRVVGYLRYWIRDNGRLAGMGGHTDSTTPYLVLSTIDYNTNTRYLLVGYHDS